MIMCGCPAAELKPKKKKAERYFDGAEAATEAEVPPAADKPKVRADVFVCFEIFLCFIWHICVTLFCAGYQSALLMTMCNLGSCVSTCELTCPHIYIHLVAEGVRCLLAKNVCHKVHAIVCSRLLCDDTAEGVSQVSLLLITCVTVTWPTLASIVQLYRTLFLIHVLWDCRKRRRRARNDS